jgi:hypothetical protein
MDILNENHVFSALNLNKCTNEEAKNLLPVKVQEYLIQKYHLNDQIESALYCDEPLSIVDYNLQNGIQS